MHVSLHIEITLEVYVFILALYFFNSFKYPTEYTSTRCRSKVLVVFGISYLLFFHFKTGSCLEAGFKSCCDPNTADNCFGYPPTCYCDEICYDFGDCCGDVVQAGCLGRPEFVLVYLTTRSFSTHSS